MASSSAPLPVTTQIAPARHPPAVEATAYFVICEALANVARHAKASRAEVTASKDGTQLVVMIRDRRRTAPAADRA
jgi:signal transduction histidine kinase